ncbi:hypothetical protein [Streptomyces sp. NPDC051684]|uniref:hypothetical protein n=1 Tax=Streptomyces sp. NPDC051684 TaxID=3365670 RepID=UPI00379E0A9B
MERKQLGVIAATAAVFVWSVAMVALGQVAMIATLAPALGLTVQQIMRAARTDRQGGPDRRQLPAADKEGHAP